MKKFVAWVNRVFTHNRDTEHDFGIRAVLHIPAGFFMGLLDWTNGFAGLFEFYERNEDRHVKDQAWKDVFGAMVGYVIGRLVLVAFLAWAVVEIVKYIRG